MHQRALPSAVVFAGAMAIFLTCGPTGPGNTPTQPSPKFIFKVKSNPLPGHESAVDAVTKASDVLDSLHVRIDSLPAGDSLEALVVDWGDSTSKTVPGAIFPVGAAFGVMPHWYVRVDTVTGICVTRATATTYGGVSIDTSIRVRVLARGAH